MSARVIRRMYFNAQRRSAPPEGTAKVPRKLRELPDRPQKLLGEQPHPPLGAHHPHQAAQEEAVCVAVEPHLGHRAVVAPPALVHQEGEAPWLLRPHRLSLYPPEAHAEWWLLEGHVQAEETVAQDP